MPSVCAGTTLVASPPCVMMPCTWSNGRRCWRSRPIATWATSSASAALMPELGRDRGVRLAALVVHAHVRNRADARVEVFRRGRVHHQRRVHAVERAAFEHQDLAAAAFFGRRADHRERDAELVDERREREPGADRAGGDDVVPARVPDHGQRVVLRADRDVQRSVADACVLNAVGRSQMPMSIGKPGVGERARGPRARLLLFELQLGMRVDAMAERDEPLALAVDRRAGGCPSRPCG